MRKIDTKMKRYQKYIHISNKKIDLGCIIVQKNVFYQSSRCAGHTSIYINAYMHGFCPCINAFYLYHKVALCIIIPEIPSFSLSLSLSLSFSLFLSLSLSNYFRPEPAKIPEIFHLFIVIFAILIYLNNININELKYR